MLFFGVSSNYGEFFLFFLLRRSYLFLKPPILWVLDFKIIRRSLTTSQLITKRQMILCLFHWTKFTRIYISIVIQSYATTEKKNSLLRRNYLLYGECVCVCMCFNRAHGTPFRIKLRRKNFLLIVKFLQPLILAQNYTNMLILCCWDRKSEIERVREMYIFTCYASNKNANNSKWNWNGVFVITFWFHAYDIMPDFKIVDSITSQAERAHFCLIKASVKNYLGVRSAQYTIMKINIST